MTAPPPSLPPGNGRQTVLLNLSMPGMDDYEPARQLRSQPGMADALLVCLSGYGQDGDRQRSREAGCDHHLLKPVEVSQLLPLLTEHDWNCQAGAG